MSEYKISYIGDQEIRNMHHIGVECNGSYYGVIFGKYVNGGFCSIPNIGKGCELSQFSDTFYNEESLGGILEDKRAAKAIAQAICDYTKEKSKFTLPVKESSELPLER